MANKNMVYLGVSGDRDTASIGMGQFVHVIRRNLNMVYIVMNNGCYGLTKGQDSATADQGSKSKAGSVNPFQAINLASLAVELGATFVGQSFSGDKTQLVPLLKAAIEHPGFAFLNVISPCITFNNNAGSTKFYDYVREHIKATDTHDFVPKRKPILSDYQEGATTTVTLHDGSDLQLNKLSSDWDPEDRFSAMTALQQAQSKGEILTGLLYVNREFKDLQGTLNTSATPLNQLSAKELCPGSAVLEGINGDFR